MISLPQPRKLVDWRAEIQARPEPAWLLQDLVFRETVIMLSGQPKLTKKSWLAFLMSTALSSGKELGMFRPVEPLPVYVVEQEGAAHPLERRFAALEASYGLTAKDWDRFHFAHMLPFFLHETKKAKELAAQVKDLGIKLVVFDTLAKVSGADENSVKEVSLAMRGIDRLREVGSSVMFLHHTVKTQRTTMRGQDVNDDIDADSRGSTALNGFVDVHIGLRRNSANQQWTQMIMRGKDFDDRRYVVDWDIADDCSKALLKWEEVQAGEAPSFVIDGAVAVLEPDTNYGIDTLKRTWGCANRDDTYLILNKLVEDGVLEQIEGGKKQWRMP